MTEDYLHYIWKFSKFDTTGIQTTEGENIKILQKGFHNKNAGPDFLESKITIGGVIWAGSVEIHTTASEWNTHKHQHDSAYDNVVLHVVYEYNKDIYNSKGDKIPTLELKGRVNEQAYFQYEQFLNNGNKLPCASLIQTVPSFLISNTLDSMLIERMERKSDEVISMLTENNGDWQSTFHQMLFRYMGMKVNDKAMMELANRIPLQLISKESETTLRCESLLFGQAGMLNETKEENHYYTILRNEYLYCKQKYNLQSMLPVQWKFSKMRPPNFPTVRIAQLAAIYTTTTQLFQIIKDCIAIKDIHLIFDVSPSKYWLQNYTFSNKNNSRTNGKIGKATIDHLIINLITPIAFAYGKNIGDSKYKDYAISLLENTKPEKNSIVKKMEEIFVNPLSAKDSQAMIQINNEYCKNKKCLHCKIGVYLVR